MPKLSAGVLLYRVRDGVVEVLIVHPGGPFWARKDDGVWSIPKGEYSDGEDPWTVALREFSEELGLAAPAGSSPAPTAPDWSAGSPIALTERGSRSRRRTTRPMRRRTRISSMAS